MKTLLATSLLLLVCPLAAQEGSAAPTSPSPLAAVEQAWTKLPAVLQRAATRLQQPWECDLELAVTSPNGTVHGQGHALYYHSRLFSLHFEVDADLSDRPVRSVIDLVADDAFVHLQSRQGEDAPVAFKLSLEALEEAFAAGPALLAMAAQSGQDPEGLDRFLASLAALDFRQEDDPAAHLARLRVDLRGLLPAGEDAPAQLEASLEFDTRHGFPRSLRLQAGEEGSVALAARALSFPEEIDETRCAYTGGPALDLSGQLRMMIQAAGVAVEENEF